MQHCKSGIYPIGISIKNVQISSILELPFLNMTHHATPWSEITLIPPPPCFKYNEEVSLKKLLPTNCHFLKQTPTMNILILISSSQGIIISYPFYPHAFSFIYISYLIHCYHFNCYPSTLSGTQAQPWGKFSEKKINRREKIGF